MSVESNMDWKQRIAITPGVRSGKPVIVGTRMAVQDVLEYLAGGDSIQEILEGFPELSADDVKACLAFAADRERLIRTNS